jgi:hypothetical protein
MRAPKIREKLLRQFPSDKRPAKSTEHAVLDRHGLIKRRKRRRYEARGMTLRDTNNPNGLWCSDYKGEFKLGNRQYCYPLTVIDYATRCLSTCEGQAFSGQAVGIREVSDKIWLVSFMLYDLGFFDEDEARVELGENPFTTKVLPMSPV